MDELKKIITAIKCWKKGTITTNLLLKLCEDSNYEIIFFPNGDVETGKFSP